MNNLAVFRCNASPEGGTGHVMRCMALAEEMERLGYEIAFAVSPGTQECVPALAASNRRILQVEPKPESEQSSFIAKMLGKPAAVLVVDDYSVGETFERVAREFSGLVAALEDRTDRKHDCDLLINSNAGLDPSIYESLTGKKTILLLGPRFAPLRPEFSGMREAALQRRSLEKAERVLVSFGGSDPANGTGLALSVLEKIQGIGIDVALGSAARLLPQLQRQYGSIAKFHIGTNEMSKLMRDADLAIGGGGSTAWERATLGLPTIVVTIADNQRDTARALHAAGAAVDLGDIRSVDSTKLKNAVEELLLNPHKRQKISAAAAKLTDGYGARRIAIALSGRKVLQDGAVIRLRRAEFEDSDLVLRWQREPDARKFSRNPNPPGEEEHARWFGLAVNDLARVFAVVLCGDRPCGFVRLDRKGAQQYEVSLLISREFQKRGIGVAALRLTRKCLPSAAFDAFILPENRASVAAFAKAGYTHAAADLMRSLPA